MRALVRNIPIFLGLGVASAAHAVLAGYDFNGNLDGVGIGGAAPTMRYFDAASQAVTAFGQTQGPSAIEQAVSNFPDGSGSFLYHPPLPNGGAGGYTLDFASGTFMANGGGAYVNNYSVVMDIFVPNQEWVALFNTNPNHSNDADWYIASDGSLGIGSIGYSSAGLIKKGTWNRIAFVSDVTDGYTRYFLNGTRVFNGAATSVDGRFSLYTSSNAGPDLAFQGEGYPDSTNYSGTAYIGSLAVADYSLSDATIGAFGGPSRFMPVPEPVSFGVLALGLIGLARRKKA